MLMRLDANGNEIAAGHLALRDAFFTPETVLTDANGGIDPVLRGLVSQLGQEVDPFLVDDVRNLLFGPMGFDLAALNMQRGRDHGLPSYVEMRDVMFGNQMGYTTFNDWSDLDGIMADAIIDALQSVYDDVRDIDLWIGGLAEAHVNGGMLGELFSAIVGDQFSRLRDGDRFWYQNGMFETEWMEFIEGSTLSAIIMRNTGITGLQANVFFVPEPGVLLLLSIGIAGMGMRRKSSWRCAG
ncbi:MAG: PEP-CTERM sorting domain-containing protein [Gammaproteobacteria bacterium]|nr:PEP-CTERM sorting domain-containing protein [Gammaproteobacteria bacterium]MCP5440715.1 PEP-CTERM sorting domain-containing protein [Chromatiaceae bacterium]